MIGNRRGLLLALCLAAVLPALAAAAPAAFQPPPPLRIGVGGDYPDGLDGALMTHGLPYERIFPWEIADPEVLKRFDVVLLSCPVATRGALDPALTAWIEAGGKAYVEVWAAQQGAFPLPALFRNMGHTPEQADVVLTSVDHAVTRGLDRTKSIDVFHLQGTFLQPLQADKTVVLAQFSPSGSISPYGNGAAIGVLPMGKGELVYSGAPLSFCLFHRGPTTETLMMSIINHLSGGRATPRLAAGGKPEPTEPIVPPAPAAQPAGKLPAGLELVEPEAESSYNVQAQVSLDPKATKPARLLLDGQFRPDGKPRRPLLALVMGPQRLELRLERTGGSSVLASAAWQPPTEPTPLLILRRAKSVIVAVGDRELLQAKTDVLPGGVIGVENGAVTLSDASYQPVEPPVFGDDFMRETGDPSPWKSVSGSWRATGPGNEKQSVNGFYYLGYGTELSVAAAGDDWWDDYTASVAARADGEATCGLAVLRQENGDCVAFIGDSSGKASATLRLVRISGGKETVLAEQPGGLASGQWFRLTVRLAAGKIEALLDGQPVLQAPREEIRGGGIGLLVRGGSGRFDDVMVQPANEPLVSPRHEGTPLVDLPESLGPQDNLTWANPAVVWRATPERPSLLWHAGDFGNDVTATLNLTPVTAAAMRRLILAPATTAPAEQWLSVTAMLQPGLPEVSLRIVAPGKAAVEKRLKLGAGGALSLSRRGDSVTLRWNETSLLTANSRGLRRVGLEVDGLPLPVQSLQVVGPDARDYVFGVAPTEWHGSAGTWEVASRWACDSRWSWFAGWGDSTFAVWNKHKVAGDVVMDYFVGIKMQAPGGNETIRCRDLNAVICGDKTNPQSGYSFILGGDGGVKTQLLRNGTVVAEAPDMCVPSGYGIHHEWFRVRVAKVGKVVTLEFEGRPVLRYEDPEPLAEGYVGLWSRNNGILVPRVTIYR